MLESLRRLCNAVRLSLAVQKRSYFLHVYLGVAVVTVTVVRLLVPAEWHALVVPAALLGEFGTMSVFMVAAQRYLDRIEGSVGALLVTPLRHGELVGSMVLAPAFVTTAAGLLVHAGVFGADLGLLWLAPTLFALTCLSGSIGLVLSSRYSEFTQFLMGSLPVVLIFSLPFLSFFELVPRYAFVWLPWDAALYSFGEVARGDLDAGTYAVKLAQLVAFAGLAWIWAGRSFHARIVEHGDMA